VHRHTVMLNAVRKAILTPVRLSITPTDLALARRTYSNNTRIRTVQDHNRNLRSTVNLTRRQEAKALHKKRIFPRWIAHAGSTHADRIPTLHNSSSITKDQEKQNCTRSCFLPTSLVSLYVLPGFSSSQAQLTCGEGTAPRFRYGCLSL
jgi:hypothetical protein